MGRCQDGQTWLQRLASLVVAFLCLGELFMRLPGWSEAFASRFKITNWRGKWLVRISDRVKRHLTNQLLYQLSYVGGLL